MKRTEIPLRSTGTPRLASLLFVASLVPALAQADEQKGASAPQAFAMPVEATEVRIAPLEKTLEAVGTLQANESIAIRPEVEGRITNVLFSEGESVKKGEVLVKLDDSIYRAELAQSEARMQLSKSNSARISSLRAKGLSSSHEVDQAQSELAVNHAAVNLARTRLEKMVIKAPFSGVVGLRVVSTGDYLSRGQDIVNLLDLDPIKVNFRIPEIFLTQIRVGQKLTMSVDAVPDKTYTGEVYAIDPQVDVNGRSLVLRARVPNPDFKLRAGLFARVDLILEHKASALLIPEEAIIPQGRRKFVYTIVEGKAVRTEITTGIRKGKEVEVVTGLAQGDTVITAGQMKVQDGAAVQPLPSPEKQVQGG